MLSRLEVHELLVETLGSRNVYFQPPSSVKMRYPAIKYSTNSINGRHADNLVYLKNTRYDVTVIDFDPDSEIVERMLMIPYCSFDRQYTSDNLNHYVFTLNV